MVPGPLFLACVPTMSDPHFVRWKVWFINILSLNLLPKFPACIWNPPNVSLSSLVLSFRNMWVLALRPGWKLISQNGPNSTLLLLVNIFVLFLGEMVVTLHTRAPVASILRELRNSHLPKPPPLPPFFGTTSDVRQFSPMFLSLCCQLTLCLLQRWNKGVSTAF